MFDNTTFKVGLSSPALSTQSGPTCLQSGNWLLHFYRILHLTPCALLLAGGNTPLPRGRCPKTSQTQKNNKIQAEGRVSADTDTTTHFLWVKSDDWEGLFLLFFCVNTLFLGKSYLLYLKYTEQKYKCNTFFRSYFSWVEIKKSSTFSMYAIGIFFSNFVHKVV